MRNFNETNGSASLLGRVGKKLLGSTAITAAGLMSLSVSAKAADDWTGHIIDSGSTTVDISIPDETNITQHTNLVKARGDADIKAGHTVNLAQPSSGSRYILFDTEVDATYILGNLNANGEVFVFDQNGVIFGADSVVDVGSLVASSGQLASTDLELEAGKIIINSLDTDGDVTNAGNITVAEAGLAAFVAPNAANSGVINAKMGTVVMAAGETVTLDLHGDGLVEVAVTGELDDGLLENTGNILARGGNVVISAALAKDAVDNVINMDGFTTVSSASVQGGKIVLSGGTSGNVNVAGDVQASGSSGQDAGSIEVTGERINVAAAGKLRTNGGPGGAAGVIDVIADDQLTIDGTVSAQGLAGTGDIETSAPNVLFGGGASILATREWLLDPTNLDIDAALAALLNAQLNIGDMTVQTNAGGAGAGNVTLQSGVGITKTAGADSTFTINAHNDISILGTITGSGPGALNVDLNADFDVSGGDSDVFVYNNIDTNGGSFTATASDDIDVRGGATINTAGGDVAITSRGLGDGSWLWMPSGVDTGTINTAGGNVDIAVSNVNLAAGSTINAGTGEVTIRRDVDGTIGLGASAGDMELTNDELNRIGASKLIIGGGKTTGIEVDTVDVSVGVTGPVQLNAMGPGGDINFHGANVFNALGAEADDDIHVTAGSSITTKTGGVVLTANNSSGGGNTVLQINGTVDTTAAGADGDVDLAATDYFVEIDSNGKVLTDGGKLTVTSNHGFDIDNGAMVMLGNGGAHIDAPKVQLGDDIDTTGSITGTASEVDVENDDAEIQDGVDVAANNATVNVAAGTYDESVIVNKTGLQLLGANAGIDGFFTVRNPESIVTGGSPAFTITRDNVTIDGFTMDGPTLTYGVKLNDVKGVEVVNNIINGSSVAAIGGVVDHDNAVQVDLLIEGNKIDDSNTGDGINISGDGAGSAASPALVGSRVDITNNLIGTDGSDAGGQNNGVGGSAIVFSTIGDLAGVVDSHWGYDVTTASEINITSNFIRGAVDGIRFDGGVDEVDVNISGNSNVNGLTGTGVKVVGDLTNSDVEINNNGTVSGRTRGIDFAGHVDGSEVEINDNTTIFARNNEAIQFNGVRGASVIDIIDNGAITSQFGNGISFRAGSPSIEGGSVVTIAHNDINAGGNDDGIFVADSVTGAATRLNIGGNTITAGDDGIDIDHISNGGHVDIGGAVAHDSTSTTTGKGNIIDAGNDGIEFDAGIDAIAQVRNNRISAGADGVHVEDQDSGHTTGVDNGAVVNILDNDIGSVGSDTIGDDGIEFNDSITGNSTVTISGNSIGRRFAKVGGDGIDLDGINGGATVRIINNPNNYASDNGIEVNGEVHNATIEISGNNHGIHANDHGIIFYSAIGGGSDIDIHGNIISANENDNSTGNGIHFGGNIYNASINIGDGTLGGFNSGASNWIRGRDGIQFAGSLNSTAAIEIDGNRIGYGKRSNGSTYEDRVDDDGIQFLGSINNDASVKITDNYIKSNDDAVSFIGQIRDNARILIGGFRDGNIIDADGNGDGVQFNDNISGHSLVEISHNDIEADNNGVVFNGDTSNHLHNGHEEEILIAHNSIDGDENGILFEGRASNRRHDIMIRDNTKIRGDGNGDHGISHTGGIDDAELTIKHNDEIYGDEDGIHLTGYFFNNSAIRIHGNSDIIGDDDDAIHVEDYGNDTGVDLEIDRNHAHWSGNNGIFVKNIEDAVIHHNTIHDVDGNGIYGSNVDNADIHDNTINDVDEHGIKINPSDNVDIAYNTIHDAGWDGIRIDDGRDATVHHNHVHRVGDDGIQVNNNRNVDIHGNTVKNTGRAWWSNDGDGIAVYNSYNADIRHNYVESAGDDGIDVERSAYADIRNNEVRHSGDDGIDVEESYRVDINNNHVHGARGDGIEVLDSFDADVIGNRIHYVGDDGIYANNVFGADIRRNNIHDARRDGIDIEDSDWVDVNFNTVTRVGGNGIEVQNSDHADIFGNRVTFARENGIYVNPSDFVDIGFNRVFFSGNDGIQVNGGHYIDIFGNITGFNRDDGIDVNGSRHVDIMYNWSFGNRDNGITVDANHSSYHYGPNRINIVGNRATYNGDNGIKVSGSTEVNGIELLVDRNTASYNDNNGIKIVADGGLFKTKVLLSSPREFNSIVSNNIVEENGENGLYASGGGHTNVEVSGNTFTENDIGAHFESGLIDLTGEGNTFTGGRVGMRFSPAIIGYSYPTTTRAAFAIPSDPIYAPLALVDDDGAGGFGGTIGAQTFDGQEEFYVELDNGAFFEPGTPTILNALDSTYVGTPFGTFTPNVNYPAGFPLDVVAFLESKFFHFNDDGTLGLFFFPLLPGIDQEDIFNYFGPYGDALAGLNVTILGLPGIPGNPVALADIAPFAGGDTSPEALNAIATAAGGDGEGGESSSCINNAALDAAGAGQAVNINYGGGAEALLAGEAGCS